MTYNEALKIITKKQSLGMVPGLSRVKALLKKMSNPQDKIRIIHIAGTNGKGSVAYTIAHALTKNGYKTGLFTSPWIFDYREQIQIDNTFISKEDFAKYVCEYKDNDCTEFEFITAIMYKYFADSKVDFAVVECGLGGAGDATNVEKENIAVITSISLDHTDILGNSIEKIANEKSGILRKNSDCILYSEDLSEVFKPKCNNLIISENSDNLSIANTVLKQLGINPADKIYQLPARCERRGNVLLDGGHNVSAAEYLVPKLNDETALIGMMKDKDVEGYLSIVAPKCKKIIATAPDNPRSMHPSQLAKLAGKYCSEVVIQENPKEALAKNPTLICGSFYLIREIIKFL